MVPLAMIRCWMNYLKVCLAPIFGATGFVSSGQGMAPSDDRVVSVIVASVFGALAGLLGGFILSHVLRFITFMTGRHLGGYSWVIIGTLAGAAVFGCLAAWRDDR
jgi:hypothetical protein